MPASSPAPSLPYRIAVLCYLFDDRNRLLLIHRAKAPNLDLYSPIGGKLEQADGESPVACAIREIHEEAAVSVSPADLHLTGIVSERSYESSGHWLIFCFEVTRPLKVDCITSREGRLEWHSLSALENLPIPRTDREVIWPLFLKHRRRFFMVHIDCTDGRLDWRLEQSS